MKLSVKKVNCYENETTDGHRWTQIIYLRPMLCASAVLKIPH
jgi:hypothetical protein